LGGLVSSATSHQTIKSTQDSQLSKVGLKHFADEFLTCRVSVVCPNLARAITNPGLIGKIRGALGVALREVGSEAVQRNKPCTWEPPCAYHLMWNKAGDVRPGYPMPAPWVIEITPRGRHLCVSVLLFGRASDYAGEVSDALVRSLRGGLSLGRAMQVRVMDRSLSEVIGVPPSNIRVQSTLRFVTPFLARKGSDDPHISPPTFLSGLIDRVDGMAQWHGAKLDCDFLALKAAAREVDGAWTDVEAVDWKRFSLPQKTSVPMQGAIGRMHLRGALGAFSDFLRIGALVHAGSRTSWGQGRYVIESAV